MNALVKRIAVPGLRWTLGLIVLLQSVHFTISHGAAKDFAKNGLPAGLHLGLGGAEVLGAILFLIPAAEIAGGYVLLCVFIAAMGLHFLRGAYDAVYLLIYAMAVLVCMSNRDDETRGRHRDG